MSTSCYTNVIELLYRHILATASYVVCLIEQSVSGVLFVSVLNMIKYYPVVFTGFSNTTQ